MRVLHVIEALGGGVVPSVLAMVEATPEVDHHVATWPRRSHDSTGDSWSSAFASVRDLPPEPAQAARALRRRTRELFPDLLHAHSSYAGALVRTAWLPGVKIAYSPHCFAFERRDGSDTGRRAVAAVERALVRRTDLLVAVSPHEAQRALDVGHHLTAFVPNRALVGSTGRAAHSSRLHVVGAGRVSPQKDWRHFLDVKRYAEQRLGVDATWEWLGGGDASGEAALMAGGVAVSGWIPRVEVLRRMRAAQVYLHTAAWEAAPISLLEAAALGLPIAARDLPSLRSLAVPGTSATAAGLAGRVADLQDPDRWLVARQASLELSAAHSVEEQRAGLLSAYDRLRPLAHQAAGA